MNLPDTLRGAAVAALPAVVAVGIAAGAVGLHLERQHRESGAADRAAAALDAALRAQTAWEEVRLDRLRLAVERLATDPDLAAAATRGEEPPGDLLETFLDRWDLDHVVVGDAEGGLVAAAGSAAAIGSTAAIGSAADAGSAAAAGSASPAGATAADRLLTGPAAAAALEEGVAVVPVAREGTLAATAAARVVREFDLVGVVAAAEAVDRGWVLEATRASRSDVAYVVAGPGGPVLVATTLDRAAAGALVPALERRGALAPVLGGGADDRPPDAAAETATLDLAGRRFAAEVAPVVAAPGIARVTLLGGEAVGSPWRRAAWIAAAAALAGLLAAALLAPWAARRLRSPVAGVDAAAAAARAGDFAAARDRPLPPAASLLLRDLEERRALAGAVAAALGRGSPSDAPGGPADGSAAATEPVWLLGLELPGYARSTADDLPQEAAARFGRDVERVRSAVAARGGRLGGVLGHRLLAVLPDEPATDGEDRPAAAALAVAAEVAAVLARPENAFDEPVPPVLALAPGRVVAGGGRTLLGLPVQQLESLLREGTSGDLLLPRHAAARLAPTFAAAGVAPVEQQGVVSPRPLHVLDGARLSALAARGAAPEGEDSSGAAADPRRRLGAGTELGGRFVLVERRAVSPPAAADLAVARFGARDRDTGRGVVVTALDRRLLEVLEPDRVLAPHAAAADPSLARLVCWGEEDGLVYLVHAEVPAAVGLDRLENGPLPAAAALGLARSVAAALAAVHREGLAHGAVGPHRVAVTAGGEVALRDLGLAALLPPPGGGEAAALLPAPRYLAPERRAGGAPSPAADVYGATAMLAGVLVGGAAVVEAGAAWPADLPPALVAVLEHGLAGSPADRIPDGDALAAALAGIGPW